MLIASRLYPSSQAFSVSPHYPSPLPFFIFSSYLYPSLSSSLFLYSLSPSLFYFFVLPSLSPLSPSLSHTFHISVLFFSDMADPSHYSKQVHRHRGKTMSHQRRSSSQVAFTRRCSAPLMEVAKSSTPQSPLSATPTELFEFFLRKNNY